MAIRRVLLVVAFALTVLATVFCTQTRAGVLEASWADLYSVTAMTGRLFQGHYHLVGVKKYFNSFTSYQFPNPFAPQLDPLSRLEFPIDQSFLGIEAGCVTTAWALRGQVWTNINRDSNLKMQDSDWEDETNPGQKTVFSESACRLNRGWLVDLQLSAATPTLMVPLFRPVVGGRYEHFYFTTHDGVQTALGGPTIDLPGDGIDFRQTFYHLYAGVILDREVSLSRVWPYLPPLKLDLQFDYAAVIAKNEDLHLLRSGERITIENTRGHCWHLALGSGCQVTSRFKARIEADFKRLITHGGHQLTNNVFAINFSFDGSRVWSDQFAVSAMGEVLF